MKFYNLLGFGCLALVSAVPAVAQSGDAGEVTRIYASVYSTNSWKEENFDEVGLYSFPVDEYSRTVVMQDPDIDASGGGVLTEDFYFCTQEYNYGSWTDVTHYIIDPDTWTTVSSLRDGDPDAVATDTTTQRPKSTAVSATEVPMCSALSTRPPASAAEFPT